MNIYKIKMLLLTVTFSLFAAGPASAEFERHGSASDRTSRSGLFYVDKALNNAIYSYWALDGVRFEAKHPQIVYVSKAYGQSIYSYPRIGPDTLTAFNLEYVSPAFGQAIYSYPGNYALPGSADLLGRVVD